jgi:hypothetical protein
MSPSAAWLRGPARLVGWLTGWSRRAKRVLMAMTDVLLIPFALWCAVALKFDNWPAGDLQVIALSSVASLFAMGVFLATGLYHSVVRFLGSSASYAIFLGVVLSALAVAVYDAVFPASSALPLSVFAIYAALAMLFVGGSRLLARHLLNAADRRCAARQPRVPACRLRRRPAVDAGRGHQQPAGGGADRIADDRAQVERRERPARDPVRVAQAASGDPQFLAAARRAREILAGHVRDHLR